MREAIFYFLRSIFRGPMKANWWLLMWPWHVNNHFSVFFQTKMMGITNIYFGYFERKYGSWSQITHYLMCQDRSAAARCCACFLWPYILYMFEKWNCISRKKIFTVSAYVFAHEIEKYISWLNFYRLYQVFNYLSRTTFRQCLLFLCSTKT